MSTSPIPSNRAFTSTISKAVSDLTSLVTVRLVGGPGRVTEASTRPTPEYTGSTGPTRGLPRGGLPRAGYHSVSFLTVLPTASAAPITNSPRRSRTITSRTTGNSASTGGSARAECPTASPINSNQIRDKDSCYKPSAGCSPVRRWLFTVSYVLIILEVCICSTGSHSFTESSVLGVHCVIR